jgi:hypothetical protein
MRRVKSKDAARNNSKKSEWGNVIRRPQDARANICRMR